MDWVVAGMFVFASSSVQVLVKVVFEVTGAKHERPFWLPTADANAPDERSWSRWRPAPDPVHSDNVI